jgi:hypothetical protein
MGYNMNCDCGGASVKDHGHSSWCKTNELDMPVNNYGTVSRFVDFKNTVRKRPLAVMGYVTDFYGNILDSELLTEHTVFKNTFVCDSRHMQYLMKQNMFDEMWIEKTALNYQDIYDLCVNTLPRSSIIRLV